MTTYRLDFGPEWSRGIVIDRAAGDRQGVRRARAGGGRSRQRSRRHPAARDRVPLATHTGWNYRDASIGAPDRLASEIGSYLPLPRTRADREKTGDSRQSIAERYASREDYLGRISLAAVDLVREQFLLAEDVPAVIERAKAHYEWATPLVRLELKTGTDVQFCNINNGFAGARGADSLGQPSAFVHHDVRALRDSAVRTPPGHGVCRCGVSGEN